MARTQKNKATSYHLGLLKARIAKLRSELISAANPKGTQKGGEGFDVAKNGDARVAIIGASAEPHRELFLFPLSFLRFLFLSFFFLSFLPLILIHNFFFQTNCILFRRISLCR
jgi:hypothetical protein